MEETDLTMTSSSTSSTITLAASLLDTIRSLHASFPLVEQAPSGEVQATRFVPVTTTRERMMTTLTPCGSEETGGGAVKVSLPALSLHHESHFADRQDRKQVEEYAACLLARPLVLVVDNGASTTSTTGTVSTASTDTTTGSTSSPTISTNPSTTVGTSTGSRPPLPLQLLENAVESFAVLVDCRLRAYATFLARHGIALAKKYESEGIIGMEQKVTKLLDTGKTIHATSMTLQFLLAAADETEIGTDDDDDSKAEADQAITTTRVPLTLEIHMDIEMTRPNGVKDLIPVDIAAVGHATASQSTTTASASATTCIDITLDTQNLLEAMIHQASTVVAAVVEVANTSSILAESKLSRSSSFLAMPPPLSKKTNSTKKLLQVQQRPAKDDNDNDGDDDDDDASKEKGPGKENSSSSSKSGTSSSSASSDHHVVSPESRAVIASLNVPSLHLHEQDKEEEDHHHLLHPPHRDPEKGPLSQSQSLLSKSNDTDDCGYDHYADEEEEDELLEDLSQLAPEVCADIVDGILGEWDDRIFTTTTTSLSTTTITAFGDREPSPPPSKKPRLVDF